uniref:Uncharacterized protein n=1 Tax=Meloidogyne incognita TaxID=6306 RepID=A0A914LDW1_MELIC
MHFKLWPIRSNEFVPERTFQWERFVYLIINGREKQGGVLPNILEEDYLEQIEFLENDIPSRVVTKLLNGWREEILINREKINGTRMEGFGKDGLLRFEDICLNWNGICYRQTGIIHLLKRRHELQSQGIDVTFPRANTRGNPIYLAFNIGGVSTFAPINDTIKSVKGMRLWYFLRSDTPLFDKMSKAWEDAAEQFVKKECILKVNVKHSRSYDNGLTRNANRYARGERGTSVELRDYNF